jgi:hypothetical protein
MQLGTLKILEITLKSDSTVATAERNRILKIARNGALAGPETENGHGNNHEPRIFSREEAAKMVGDKTTRFVDLLARRGLLKKFTPKGNKRAIGICGESLRAFIEGN